ncbi:hypothetical protein H6F88_01130 [Oculatella sp. FACHB-28]|uniref:hypothetical protein n=1 Tax=Oculatella sp. FACHB-28 TaxID=2692845 RepID=UPI001684BF5C|nr:hypothetical protein [Oculatella sp. FACHB-28]MBD2054644.1 hypothetical protein [Oculatella sp. FACHB-28]
MAETLTSSTEFSLPLPEKFPHSTSAPKFNLGDQVCWHPLPSQDFGTIVGLQYAPASHLKAWSWRYLILLSPASPSRAWVQADLAWEDDLRLPGFP